MAIPIYVVPYCVILHFGLGLMASELKGLNSVYILLFPCKLQGYCNVMCTLYVNLGLYCSTDMLQN